MPPEDRATFIVYSRPGCHLCDDMVHLLKQIQPPPYKTLHVINIDETPAHQKRYSMDIPVLNIDGIDAFRYRVTSEDLTSWLNSSNRPSYLA